MCSKSLKLSRFTLNGALEIICFCNLQTYDWMQWVCHLRFAVYWVAAARWSLVCCEPCVTWSLTSQSISQSPTEFANSSRFTGSPVRSSRLAKYPFPFLVTCAQYAMVCETYHRPHPCWASQQLQLRAARKMANKIYVNATKMHYSINFLTNIFKKCSFPDPSQTRSPPVREGTPSPHFNPLVVFGHSLPSPASWSLNLGSSAIQFPVDPIYSYYTGPDLLCSTVFHF